MLKAKKSFFAAAVVCCFTIAVCKPLVAGTSNPGWPVLENIRTLNTEGMLSQSQSCGNLAGVMYNPAFIAINTPRMLELTSESGFADDKLARVLYGHPALGGELMAGAAYYDAGCVELNWVDNNAMMSQTVSLEKDSVGMLAYGRKICDGVYGGLNIKAASSEIAQAQTARAYSADAGVMVGVNRHLMLSLALLNSGTSTKFIDESDPLPQTGSLGLIYDDKIGACTSLALGAGAFYDLVDEKYIYTAGATVRYGGVYVNAEFSSQDSQQSFTYGGGINFNRYMLGLSITQTSYIDAIQKLNLGVKF
jgi:hypothetical protein